jgi:hypothetical protein
MRVARSEAINREVAKRAKKEREGASAQFFAFFLRGLRDFAIDSTFARASTASLAHVLRNRALRLSAIFKPDPDFR